MTEKDAQIESFCGARESYEGERIWSLKKVSIY